MGVALRRDTVLPAKVLPFTRSGLVKVKGEIWGDEWREVFQKAREVAYDKDADPDAREFWRAIVEGRVDDAAEILNEAWTKI